MASGLWLCLALLAWINVGVPRLFAESIAVIGDGTSTGFAAHPALSFDFEQFEKNFQGKIKIEPDKNYYDRLQGSWEGIESVVEKPQRLPLSRREYGHPLSWVYKTALHSFSHQNLDAEEYSWIYLLGRKLKINPKDILIAASDGAKAEDAVRQIDRILDATDNQAVSHLFVFFTSNDLCAVDSGFATSPNEFGEHIETALRYYVNNTKPSKSIRHIWLLNPLAILQMVSSPEILNHHVQAYGKNVSCLDLQMGRISRNNIPISTQREVGMDQIFLQILGQGPRIFCPSLFAVHDDLNSSERMMKLGSFLGGYRQNLQKLVAKIQNISPSFRVHQLRAPGEVTFGGADVAHDCFSLNLDGQLKVAGAVHDEMSRIIP